MKLNITPGPWTQIGWDIKFKTELTIANALVLDDAAAIVTAVNNTYHKGINPEAVPEMINIITAITMLSSEGKVPDSVIQAAKTILQKATL